MVEEPLHESDAAELARLRRLRAAGRLLEVDYAYELGERPWHHSHAMHRLYARIQQSEPRALELLQRFAELVPHLLRIPIDPDGGVPNAGPHWRNGWLPAVDAVAIYGFLVLRNPRLYVEIGSGNSTKFARRAIEDHGLRTRILSIDPEPRAEIDALCDQVVRRRLEDLDAEHFTELDSEDLVFVDDSHRAFQGSDVTVFFTEVLPALPRGVLYGIHDIYLPQDYPRVWRERLYNEQYLLAAYLFGGADGDRIVLPANHVSTQWQARTLLDALWKSPAHVGIEPRGCSFWMERAGQ